MKIKKSFKKGKIYSVDEVDYEIIPSEYALSFDNTFERGKMNDSVKCLRDVEISVEVKIKEIFGELAE